METRTLEDMGLTKSEALVYLALCEIGPSTTGKIVQKSGVASSKIYELLNKLEVKGLVGHVIKTGIREFEAAPPERILLYLEEKEDELKKEKTRAEKLIELLKSKKSLQKNEQEATIYRGMKGMKTVFYQCTDEMKPGSEILVMGVPNRSSRVDRFFVKWNKYHASKKIRKRIIFDESARGDKQTFEENNPLSGVKFMSEEVLTPAAVDIFDDKVIIFPAESGNDPILFLIRSKEIADSFRAQFELLWNQNVRTFYGVEGPRTVLNELISCKADNLAFGLSDDKLKKHVPDELTELMKAQDERKVKTPRLIFTGNIVKSELSKRNMKYKTLPEKFSTPFHYEIYGNKVAIFYWIDPIITTIIENKQVADNFRNHFEKMWKVAN